MPLTMSLKDEHQLLPQATSTATLKATKLPNRWLHPSAHHHPTNYHYDSSNETNYTITISHGLIDDESNA